MRMSHQLPGLPSAFRTNRIHSGSSQNFRTFRGGVESGNHGRAVEPAERTRRVFHPLLECEWSRVRLPASNRRRQLVAHSRRNVEEAATGSAAQPLQNAAGEKIHSALLYIHRDYTHRMERVERDHRTDVVRLATNGIGIIDECRLEDDMRHRDELRSLIDRREKLLLIDGDSIV